jgi:hypothetical protein
MLYGRRLDTLELLGDLHLGGHRTDRMSSKLCAGAPMCSRYDGACERRQTAALGVWQIAKRGAPSHRRDEDRIVRVGCEPPMPTGVVPVLHRS